MALHQGGQPVMSFAEVHGFGRHEYLHPIGLMDHSAAAISATRVTGVAARVNNNTKLCEKLRRHIHGVHP